MGMLDGKVAIVTGAGRGIGREEALLLASEGAKVIVNDVGASLQGEGGDKHPAEEVVELDQGRRQRRRGQRLRRQLVAGGQGPGRPGRRHLRPTRHPGQQRRHPPGQDELQHGGVGLGRRHPGPPEGPLRPLPPRRRLLAGRAKAGETCQRPHRQHRPRRPGCSATPARPTTPRPRAGIASLTWVLARELERYGITVNSISPRARTRMTENLFGEHGQGRRGLRQVRPAQRRPAGRLPGLRRGLRRHRAELRGLRGRHLGHGRVPRGRRGAPRLHVDAGGAGRAPRASCSRASRRACPLSASPRRAGPPAAGRPVQRPAARSAASGTTAVASPTTFSSPSALSRRTSRSTRWSSPSVRLPVTTIVVRELLVGPGLLGEAHLVPADVARPRRSR